MARFGCRSRGKRWSGFTSSMKASLRNFRSLYSANSISLIPSIGRDTSSSCVESFDKCDTGSRREGFESSLRASCAKTTRYGSSESMRPKAPAIDSVEAKEGHRATSSGNKGS